MIINIAHIVHICHLSQPKKFVGIRRSESERKCFQVHNTNSKNRSCGSAFIFCGYGSRSSCSSQCGSGSSCFFNAGSDTDPALKKIYLTKSFLGFFFNFSLLDPGEKKNADPDPQTWLKQQSFLLQLRARSVTGWRHGGELSLFCW